jgi:hypothetical protein
MNCQLNFPAEVPLTLFVNSIMKNKKQKCIVLLFMKNEYASKRYSHIESFTLLNGQNYQILEDYYYSFAKFNKKAL